MKPRSADAVAALVNDQDITTTRSRRRAFLKAVGGGSLLLATGAVTAAGCSGRSDSCRTTVDTDPRDPVSGRLACDGD